MIRRLNGHFGILKDLVLPFFQIAGSVTARCADPQLKTHKMLSLLIKAQWSERQVCPWENGFGKS